MATAEENQAGVAGPRDVPAKKRKGSWNTEPPFIAKRSRAAGLPSFPGSACDPAFPLISPEMAMEDFFARFAFAEAVLGSGQYGTVRECTDSLTGERLACKTITKNEAEAEAQAEELRSEVDVMSRLAGHENVVQLRGVMEEEAEVHLVMDLCQGGELYDEVVRRERFNEADAAHLFAELVRAVAFCHSRGILHRDLKPENVLLSQPLPTGVPLSEVASEGPLIKLADFGLATTLVPGQLTSGVAGSPFYMAPEVLTGEYGLKADVWSLGVILYILLSGTPPFWGPSDSKVFQAILNKAPDLSSGIWKGISLEARSLIKRLLVKDPAGRPSAQKILSHPWLVGHLTSLDRVPRGRMHSASGVVTERVA